MNNYERQTISDRFELEEWTLDNLDKGKNNNGAQAILNRNTSDKLDELDKSLQKDKTNNISDKMLFDIAYQKDSTKHLAHYQNELYRIITRVNKKINKVSDEIKRDITLEDRKIFNSQIQDQLEKYQEEVANSRDNDYNKKFVDFLKKNLVDEQAGEEGLDKFNTYVQKYVEDIRKHKMKLENEQQERKRPDQTAANRFTFM